LDQARLVLDYVEALVWPVVVAGLLGAALALFRPEIGRLIDRMRRLAVGPGSAEFTQGEQGVPGRGEPVDGAPDKVAELVRQRAEELEREYGTRVAELSERLGATDFYWFCERVYRTIYGSQIRLLQHLQARADAGSSVPELVVFFQQHVEAVRLVNPAYGGSFEAYVGYLAASQLIVQDPTAPTRYRISPQGVGFLAYLPWAGIPAWKPY
jgi:hypothetical protein